MKTDIVNIENPESLNLILGQAHFIKTVEDLYEILIASMPSVRFGLAFCEASGDRLIRKDGTDAELIDLAVNNARRIAAGHIFIIFMRDCFPINVLNQIKNCPEVCRVFCATSNPLEVIVCETEKGRGVVGVIDGEIPLGVENDKKTRERREFLREIGYKR